SLCASKTVSAFLFVAWESTPELSSSLWVYTIQLSLPRVISCHTNNHSAHPVRQWPESRVAYPTKAPYAGIENGKTPSRAFLDSSSTSSGVATLARTRSPQLLRFKHC